VGAFTPLDSRARWAIIALVAAAVANAFAIGVDIAEIDLMNRVIRGDESVTISDLDASDTRQAISGFAFLVTLILGAIFFIRWFHAAYKNLRVLDQPKLRFGDGWAIGSWFVPILNLWRPKQIANDIWRGSDPNAPRGIGEWKNYPVAPLLGLWWAAWIVTNVLGNFVGRLWLEGDDTADDIRTADYVDLVSSVAEIVAAVLAILVVRAITRRENDLSTRTAQTLDERSTDIYSSYLLPEADPKPPEA